MQEHTHKHTNTKRTKQRKQTRNSSKQTTNKQHPLETTQTQTYKAKLKK